MAEATESAPVTEAAPVITQGQTTTVAEGAAASQEQPAVVPEAAPEEAPGFFNNPLLWIVAAVWIWFLFGNKKRKAARAQQKKDAERRATLQKGDNIVTIGRMHGAVVAFTDTTVTIKPDAKAEYTMTFDRQAIYQVLPRPGEEVEEAPAK